MKNKVDEETFKKMAKISNYFLKINFSQNIGKVKNLLRRRDVNSVFVNILNFQVALQDRVYERVKNACLRSLSCEVSAASKKNPVQPPPPPLSRSTTPRKIHPYVIHEEPLHG